MVLNPYAVKTLVLTSGERLPVLIALATGAPLFEPSVYVLSEIRATNRASNTIDQVLRSIMVLQLFLDSSGIISEQRIRQRGVFRLNELDELVWHCRRPVADQLKRNSILPPRQSVRKSPRKAFALFKDSLHQLRWRATPLLTALGSSVTILIGL